MRRRDAGTQVALLDRIAGAARGAARFGSGLRRLRGLEAEAAALDALGGAAQRGALQAMVDQARARAAPCARLSRKRSPIGYGFAPSSRLHGSWQLARAGDPPLGSPRWGR